MEKSIWTGVLNQATQVADAKKHRIIEATIKLIAHQGLEAVTFESVGKILKTTKANIRYHYQSKDELIFTAARAVVVNAQAHTAARVEKVHSPEDKLLTIIESAFDWYVQFPDHVKVWALFMYYALVHPEYAEFFHKTRQTGQARMELLLRALPRSGDASFGKLAEEIQNIIYGQITGLGGNIKLVRPNRLATIEMVSDLLAAKGLRWSPKR